MSCLLPEDAPVSALREKLVDKLCDKMHHDELVGEAVCVLVNTVQLSILQLIDDDYNCSEFSPKSHIVP
jgi:hypothetical protein